MNDVTRVLNGIREGQPRAAEELLPLVYGELRRLAAFKMAGESSGHTLQATALVHEAWMRLVGTEDQTWENRNHFFSAAAEAMRRILVEHARRKHSLKRGGAVGLEPLEESSLVLKDKQAVLDQQNHELRLAQQDLEQKAADLANRLEGAQKRQSLLGRAGRLIEPLVIGRRPHFRESGQQAIPGEHRPSLVYVTRSVGATRPSL